MMLALLLGAVLAAQSPAGISAPDHPQPGPYFVVTGDAGRIASDQQAVIANALGAWSGNHLGAFRLCFRPKSEPTDWKAALAALDAVSRSLKDGGAKIVVVDAERICDTPGSPELAGRSHIEIRGVIAADTPPQPLP